VCVCGGVLICCVVCLNLFSPSSKLFIVKLVVKVTSVEAILPLYYLFSPASNTNMAITLTSEV
jgi:hypothetical protein